jgi:hypothetical protein
MQQIFTLLFLAVSASFLKAGSECTDCGQLNFKENKGQWDPNILYKTEMRSGAVFFEKDVITFNLLDERDILRIKGDHHKLENYTPTIDYRLNFHAFKMRFESATSQVKSEGSEAINEYFNYFIGNDKNKWASKVKAFHHLEYRNLYNGINLKISSKGSSLKYVYEVEKGSDVSQLKISFDGTDGLQVNEQGNLRIKTSVGDVLDMKP